VKQKLPKHTAVEGMFKFNNNLRGHGLCL